DIDAAPPGPFDGAASLLTFHFIRPEKRVDTLRGIRKRLAPSAPLIVAHISFPQAEPERSRWISRHVAFGGTPPEKAKDAEHAIRTRLTILDPVEEEAQLRSAGFTGIGLFYAGLSFRGWVAYAG
ncbi:methyltransferase, partial [Paenibacillus dendritiformis]